MFTLFCFVAPGPGAYIHYTLTGYVGHDPSKFREPAYTIRPITFLNRCKYLKVKFVIFGCVLWINDTSYSNSV